jgi:hypothetical protein
MDLVRNLDKAKTHFFALTLRRHTEETDTRKYYSLVDAEVLPLSLLDDKFRHTADAATGQPVNHMDMLRRECAPLMREGALGTMIAMYIELGPEEEKSVEQAVKDVSRTGEFRGTLWLTG